MDKSIYTSNQEKLLLLLKQLREKTGLSQKELAKRINRSQSFISKYETGELRLDLLELYQICNALDTPLHEFVKRFEDALHESK